MPSTSRPPRNVSVVKATTTTFTAVAATAERVSDIQSRCYTVSRKKYANLSVYLFIVKRSPWGQEDPRKVILFVSFRFIIGFYCMYILQLCCCVLLYIYVLFWFSCQYTCHVKDSSDDTLVW